MSSKQFSLLAVLLLTASVPQLSAQLLIDNNFDSVSVATYDGSVGEAFGVADALGNASFENDPNVLAAGGVGNSAFLHFDSTDGMRSRNTGTTTFQTTFSLNFLATEQTPSNYRGGLGVGWGINQDNTDLHNAGNDRATRLMVGLRYEDGATTATTDDFYTIGYMTEFQSNTIIDFSGPSVTFDAPSSETWYSMNFDLIFNDTTDEWTLSGLEIRDGSSNLVASISSATFSIQTSQLNGSPSLLDTNTSANAILAGWGDRNGVNGLDNVQVSQVPEPSSFAMLMGGLGLVILRRRTRL